MVTALCYVSVYEVHHRHGYARAEDWPGIRGEENGALPAFAFPIDVATITASAARTEQVEWHTPDRERDLLATIGLTPEMLGVGNRGGRERS